MDNAIDRLPPNNPEAEETVLGNCLIDPDAIDRVLDCLGAEDFYRDRNRAIYEVMRVLRQRHEPVDVVSVSDELKRCGRYDEVGGFPYLHKLGGIPFSAVHVCHYAAIVTRCAAKRRLITAAGKIAAVAYDDTLDAETSLDKAAEILAKARAGTTLKDVYSPEDQAEMLFDMVTRAGEGREMGIPSQFITREGWSVLDYRPGCLYVIGAVTKMGKTSWMASEARYMAGRGHRIHFASGEMTVLEMVKRNAAAIAGREWTEMEREARKPVAYPDTQTELRGIIDRMPQLVPWVYDGQGMTVEAIRSRVARMQTEEGGCDAVFVDYLQRLKPPSKRDERYEQIDAIAEGLKTMARELAVPVIVAAQFNAKTVMGRPLKDRVPVFTDFRESGGIAQEADVALGLHRWSKYADALDGAPVDQSEAWLHVLANRHGKEDVKVKLRWIGATATYKSAYDAEGRSL